MKRNQTGNRSKQSATVWPACSSAYHTLQRFVGFNLLSFGQLKAFENSSMLDKTPFTLKN